MRKYFLIALILTLTMALANGQANHGQDKQSQDYRQGLELFEQDRYNQSIKYFERFISRSEQDELTKRQADIRHARFLIAVASRYSDSPMAEKLLLNYLDSDAGGQDVYIASYHLGDLYFEKKNYKDAVKYFGQTEVTALTPAQKEDLTFKTAFSHFALKDFNKAFQSFAPLTRNTQSELYEDAIYYSGLSAYYLKRYRVAEDLFRQLDQSKKYNTTTPYYISAILFQTEDYDGMIAYAEPLLKSEKRLKYVNQIKKLLGNAYFEKENYGAAEKYLAESIRALSRISQEDYYQLGYVYYKNGSCKEAVEQMQKLTSQDNEMVQNAMFILGQCYTKMGDKANAKAAFVRASKMKYDEAVTEESHFNIAKITYEQGNNTETLTLLKDFIRLYPNSSYNSEAQNLLADVFFKTKSYEEAIRTIEGMKNINSQIKASYQKMTFYRAMEYYSNNQMAQADEYLNKSLTFLTDRSLEALAYYWKADIAHLKERYEESNQWLVKFNPLASYISTEHSSRVSAGSGFYLQGYNSYKKRDFVSAQILFSKALENLKNEKDAVVQTTVYPDARMRLSDSYYMQKKYSEALVNYSQVMNSKAKGADYAAYQSAMIQGLTGNINGKIEGLEKTASNYPNSTYADDALFELGNTYNHVGRGAEAIFTFRSLIKNYPKSEFVPYAYNRIGLIQYNQDKPQEALASYKHVIQNYPKTEASQEALIAVKDVYISLGDPNGYFDLMKQFPGAMISTSAQDSIVYQVAESQYLKGDYAQAVKGFDSYISAYKNGAFILPARFYRGESKYFSGDQIGALPDYRYVTEQITNRFTETAASRAAVISYSQKDYKESARYYGMLHDIASTEDSRNDAVLGGLRSYYRAGDYTSTINYAEKALTIKGLSETVQVEAVFYKGAALYHLGNISDAKSNLSSVVKRINNEWAAESQYILAAIAYKNGNMKEAEDLCFEYISNYPSYPEWMVRTYILLSDVYVANQDYFKARVTLESVTGSYGKQDELYREAAEKLEKVKALENAGSKLIQPKNASGFSEFE